MKKLSILLAMFLLFTGVAAYSVTPVDFIYINGSNNNTEKMRNWFLTGIEKLHPELKKQLEKNEFTYKHMLKDGEYVIQDTPSNYFWGFKSKQDLLAMQENAEMLQSISPWIAYFTRITISNIMHDAIWVTKEHNLIPIIQELDVQVKADIKDGKKVVLLGYSAGTFITLEYIGRRVAYINMEDWFNTHKIDSDLQDMIKKNPRKDTCTTAFVASNLTTITPLGKVIPTKNKDEFKKAYMEIDKYTDTYCVPTDSILGVINYASPIPLFYSDLADSNNASSEFLAMMYKYLVEQDFFFLTVNFADDPLGFPNGVNLTNKDIEKYLNVNFSEPKGFFYDYSKNISWRTVLAAHTSYFNARKIFSKAIVKGYTEGYNFQYGNSCGK